MSRPRNIATRLWLVGLCLLSSPPAHAQDNPQALVDGTDAASTEAAPGLILREILVIQSDRYDDQANNPSLVTTTLSAPFLHRGRSKRVDVNGNYAYEAMPLGLITFAGQASEPIKLRLSLQHDADRFHASWPNTAVVSHQLVQWGPLQDAQADARSVPLPGWDNWIAPLREGEDRLWLQSPGTPGKERFLLYDASFKFKPAVDLKPHGEQYQLLSKAPDQASPPLSILLRQKDGSWLADALASPWPNPTPSIGAPDAAKPVTTLEQALQPIEQLLEQRGYNAQETHFAIQSIASAGLDRSGFSLVYVMPAGQTDEYIKLQVRPAPTQTIRTSIVVVNNIDPNLGSQVQALIADLGSPQWSKRDLAQRQLIDLGQAAIKQVQSVKDSPDPEVAFRARQILDTYDWKMSGQ